MAAFHNENIRGLDVPMDDSLGMRGIERVSDLNRQAQQSMGFDRLAGDAMPQRHAFQKLHGDERLPVLLADIIDSTDIRMV